MTNEPTTKERIRREAAALFREKGFNGTSMAELAGAVGITKSSLYHHYPSKQALLSEIIEVTVSRVTPLLQEVAESDLPIRERLGRAVSLHTVEAIHDRDAVACFIEEGRYLAPDFMAAHVAKRDRYELIFRRMFEEGIASGEYCKSSVSLGHEGQNISETRDPTLRCGAPGRAFKDLVVVGRGGVAGLASLDFGITTAVQLGRGWKCFANLEHRIGQPLK